MPTDPFFCVSVHDVSPHTWLECDRLINSLPVLKGLPLTLLLVPDWHRRGISSSKANAGFEQAISHRQAQGNEICLHGYTHLDEQPFSVRDYWRRRVLTRAEGEFSAIDDGSARERLQGGQCWLAERGWHAHGFVPPAWMINAQGIRAVRDAGFEYLGLYRGWRRLADGKSIAAPTITYSTRHPLGDALWRGWQDLLLSDNRAGRLVPVMRLALHPADLHRPGNLVHANRMIKRWLDYRTPLTEHQAYRKSAGQPPLVQQERITPI